MRRDPETSAGHQRQPVTAAEAEGCGLCGCRPAPAPAPDRPRPGSAAAAARRTHAAMGARSPALPLLLLLWAVLLLGSLGSLRCGATPVEDPQNLLRTLRAMAAAGYDPEPVDLTESRAFRGLPRRELEELEDAVLQREMRAQAELQAEPLPMPLPMVGAAPNSKEEHKRNSYMICLFKICNMGMKRKN